ncbi:ABC transporter ATP-binding protein [Aerococcus agrisoli]|uniref:ABC transporter ATP-binding protein n=1 Tax=Aerococcus agrisoli TaxID=2487350 RepID=A0A3N4H6I3_9LACT|nr:ABC transporter ATP-binding protein [Aerococcus agrisoli]RPA60804.1 ABC transporter ATP-binding protein [Aerococcus agrisoli]
MITLDHVNFAYSDTDALVLDDISLTIPTGSFVAVVGDNGAGKSTFCKLLNGIIPHFIDGELDGTITVDGQDISNLKPSQLAHKIGYVYQDFENQILRPKVLDDAAFGLLNAGEEDYVNISMEILATLDLAHLADEYVWQLSGGQKHLLALAGVLVMSPNVIVLDEPIAQLDPIHALKIYENLAYLNRDLGKTIIVIEHNADFIGKYCDHMLFMKDHKVEWFLPVKDALQRVDELISGGIYPPQVTLLGHELRKKGLSQDLTLPIDLPEAHDFMTAAQVPAVTQVEAGYARGAGQVHRLSDVDPDADLFTKEAIIQLKDVSVEYDRINESAHRVIDHMTLDINKGDRLAIIGNNGAGKSSIMKLLMGLVKAKTGQVLIDDHYTKNLRPEEISNILGYVYQNPENMFIEDSIEKDIAYSMKARGHKDYQERADALLAQFHLSDLRDRDGRLLSGGQMRRASLAIGVSLGPKALLLDEPTASLDMATRQRITQTLRDVSSSIETVIIATHDMQLVAEWANRIIVVNQGQIIGDGTREEIFNNPDLLAQAGIAVPAIIELTRDLDGDTYYSVGDYMADLAHCLNQEEEWEEIG